MQHIKRTQEDLNVVPTLGSYQSRIWRDVIVQHSKAGQDACIFVYMALKQSPKNIFS